MCLILNNIMPKGEVHFKVFAEKDGRLYLPWRDLNGKVETNGLNNREAKNGITSTAMGFHCFEDREHAEKFAVWLSWIISEYNYPRYGSLVVKAVKCDGLMASGLAYYGGSIEEVVSGKDNGKMGQAYAYHTIKTIG